ncbi:MAG TPA: tetratricopeptide repeat protein [Pirellulales bacterium]|nr:tetratricopeptide repeat protein [Pirellulales bacterium]
MNPSDVRLDAHGFPIPPTLGPLQAAESPEAPRRTPRGTFTLRLLLILLALGAGTMAIVRAELGEPISRRVAEWLAGHAFQKQAADDLDGALRDLDRALAWTDKSAQIYAFRGTVRLEKGDLEGSLADFNRVISLAPTSSDAFELRSMCLQRMERHDDAIRDINEAVRMYRAAPHLLNSRAYIRAIANRELDEALADIQQALEMEPDNAHYLDTRGYIYYLRGEDGEALKDLDRALEIAEQQVPTGMFLANHPHRGRVLARAIRRHENAMAVMYHHRGLVHERLGHSELAEADLRQGDAFGYNPAAGVY